MSRCPLRIDPSTPAARLSGAGLLLLLALGAAHAQAPAESPELAPTDVGAEPAPDDDSGGLAIVQWMRPEGEPPEGMELRGYRLYRSTNGREFEGLFDFTKHRELDAAQQRWLRVEPLGLSDTALGWLRAVGWVDPDHYVRTQAMELWTWKEYRFQVAALYAPVGAEGIYAPGQPVPPTEDDEVAAVLADEYISGESESVTTTGKWYNVARTNVLVCALLYAMIVVWYIQSARRGKDIYIRPIAGMAAVDEAIGRATEMGKPILYVSGLTGLGSISTITSLTILGRVARRTAEYETPLLVPCNDALVMLAAREIVREAYMDAGKPDAYREQDIFFVTDRQFAYVAGVDGIMLREKPAANMYMGYFYAEALILAETGSTTGAIQIAGTDADTQIPFFVTACDYTLMGEELYAATAYLSRDPLLLAQLKAQDVGKAALGVLFALGTVAYSVAVLLALSGSGWMNAVGKGIEWAIALLPQ